MRTVASTTSTSASSTDPAAATSPSRARTPGLVIPGPAFSCIAFIAPFQGVVPMVKPSRARMRSALLGSLIALLPALPALAADPTPATEAPGPQLRTGSLMLIPAPATVQRGQGSGITVRADTALHAEGEAAQRVATSSPTCWRAVAVRALRRPRARRQPPRAASASRSCPPSVTAASYTLESTAQGVVIRPATKPACSTAQPRLPSWPRAEATACCPRYRSGTRRASAGAVSCSTRHGISRARTRSSACSMRWPRTSSIPSTGT